MPDYLWQKDAASVDDRVMAFMAGDDVILDRQLFVYDLRASRAHAKGLAKIGLLDEVELRVLLGSLDKLERDFVSGRFVLNERYEDGHSAIEAVLTEELGPTGKKIHTGRSRNDQVLVATRLYLLDALAQLEQHCLTSAGAFLSQARAHPHTPMPGYTHLQHAVVSSTGLWFAAFAEAFIDNTALLRATASWLSCNPLGTAAGYGVNLPLDRALTTRELGFERMQVNAMYAQNSRGKFELQALAALAQALLDMRRFAWDVSLFMAPEYRFVTLPDRFTTGSSIMPNKRNPDLIELMRGGYAVVQGAISELQAVLSLPSGYQRDVQFTKGPVLRAMAHGVQAMALLPEVVGELRFDAQRLREAITPAMQATDVAQALAAEGVPFRDAYRQALSDPERLASITPEQSLANRVSPGSPGNLLLDELGDRIARLQRG
jgi:argininosuccinate lyase